MFLAVAMLLVAASARAHEDPPGCFETGPAVVVSVFRANGTTGVVGNVSECETINYRATLSKANDSGTICAFSQGTFVLTTPDGVAHTISPNVPCIGGTSGEGCDPTVTQLQSALIPYTVSDADVVAGNIVADAVYANGITHDSPDNTSGVGAETPKTTPVFLCPDNEPCTTFVCDPNAQGADACDATPINCNDNDLCTIDGCDSATGCFADPVVCPDNDVCVDVECDPTTGNCVGTPILNCDDNDPCTDDFCDPVEGCQHIPNNNPGCVGENHFMCYEIKPFAFPRRTISVEDRFFDAPVTLRGPTHLCAPADKNDENPNAPLDPEHLTGFPARGATGRVLNQTVTDQFGTRTLDLRRRSHLFVPTAKSLTSPPGPLVNPVTDHFQCYRIRRSRGSASFSKITGVKVDDQFGTATMDLLRPRFACLAANKADEDPTAPSNPNGLLCYKTRQQASFGDALPFIDNQILDRQVEIIRRFELCVPATIGAVPTTTTTIVGPTTTTVTPTTVGPSTTVTTTSTAPTTSSTSTTLPGSASQAFLDLR